MIHETISKVKSNFIGAAMGAGAGWFGSHKMGVSNHYAKIGLAIAGALIGAEIQSKMHKPTVVSADKAGK